MPPTAKRQHARSAYAKVKARAKTRSAAVTLAGQDIGGLPVRRAQGKPLDSAQGKPLDSAQSKPFDSARGKPLDSARGKPFDSARGEPFDSARGKPPIADRVHHGQADRCLEHFHCGMNSVVPQN
jgi:hypothetical protein